MNNAGLIFPSFIDFSHISQLWRLEQYSTRMLWTDKGTCRISVYGMHTCTGVDPSMPSAHPPLLGGSRGMSPQKI